MARTRPCQGRGHGFESRSPLQIISPSPCISWFSMIISSMEELLKRLISIESTSDKPEALAACLFEIRAYLSDVPGVEFREYIHNSKPSLVVANSGGNKFDYIFSGHIDVVPADPEMFSPYVQDAKLYGRGASDMKGAVVAMIEAFRRLQLSGKSDGSIPRIALLITSDEEQGGADGARYLIEKEGYYAPTVLLPDGGTGNWDVCTDEKGVWWVDIMVKNAGGHASRPWQAKNSIEAAVEFAKHVQDAVKQLWGECTPTNPWAPTVNIGSISGGEAYNQIAEYCTVGLDIRYGAEHGPDKIKQLILDKAQDMGYQVIEKLSGLPSHTDSKEAELVKWLEAVANIRGSIPNLYKANGGSDGRFFSRAGMTVVNTKPTASSTHGDVEWVDLDQLIVFVEVIESWILR